MARFPYREIIELYSTGISMKKVAYLCGIGINKARDVLVSSNPSRYQQLGARTFSWTIAALAHVPMVAQPAVDALDMVDHEP